MGDLSYAPKVGGNTLAQPPQVAPQPTVGKSTLVGQTEEPRAETENKRLPEHAFDQEVQLPGPFPFRGGKVSASLKLDAKHSAIGKVETPIGSATLFDAKAAHEWLEGAKVKYKPKVSNTLAKVETTSTSLDGILPVPGWHVKVDGALAKVGGGKVEGPSVSVVAWCDLSSELPPGARAKYSLRLEIKIEMPIPEKAVKNAIEDEESLRKEADALEQTAKDEKTALDAAKREVRSAEQALDKARQQKNNTKGIAEAMERLRKAKGAKRAAGEALEVATQGAKRLALRCIEAGTRLAERIAALPVVERAAIIAAESLLVRGIGHALGYLIPIVDAALLAYDLYTLGVIANDLLRGRATLAIWDPDGEFRDALSSGATWASSLLASTGGPAFHPTKAQAAELNAAVPDDLTPSEQDQIRARWQASTRKGDDFTAGMEELKKVIAEVRAQTRARMTPEQLDATGTNPGAQRIASALWGSDILSQEEFRILCETIPADLTLEELAKLRPYLQKRGDKADVRLIAGWIAQLRAGQKITLPPPGSGADPNSKAKEDAPGTGDGGGADDATRTVEALTSKKGAGGGDRERKAKTAGGGAAGGKGKGKGGGGETAGVLVPNNTAGAGTTPVAFTLNRKNAPVGTIVQVSIYVFDQRISRSMPARIVARGGGRTTVELILGSRVSLQRTKDGHGPIFVPNMRFTF